MAKRGGQPGNNNRSKNKEWTEAIGKAVLQYQKDDVKRGEALYKIATKVVQKALEGDRDAIREIGDRLDGKPHQSVDIAEEVTWVVRLPEIAQSTETWEAKWLPDPPKQLT